MSCLALDVSREARMTFSIPADEEELPLVEPRGAHCRDYLDLLSCLLVCSSLTALRPGYRGVGGGCLDAPGGAGLPGEIPAGDLCVSC